MTLQEFSDSFDTLLYSHAGQAQFGEQASKGEIVLNEYEKSLYLTKAQEELVQSLYNGRNSSLQSFEETEELRRYLSPLIADDELPPVVNESGKPIGIRGEKNTAFFTLPENLWFITYESVELTEGKCEGHTTMEVVPVTQDEYHKIRKNPFRGANDRRALRLDLPDNMVEVICKYPVSEYYVRYLKKLKPIILVNLPEGLTIGGISGETPSEVHEGLHQRILDMAVEMALRSKLGVSSRQSQGDTKQ